MSAHSAGILLFRFREERLQVLLVHPGGPFWSGKDEGAWSIPKGGFEEQETPLEAAKREFEEETGYEVEGQFIDLGIIKQPSKKIVHVWAQQSNLDAALATSNKFTMQWPRKSGIMREFPEIDKAEWFDFEKARKKILKGQAGFMDRLLEAVNYEQKKEGESQAARWTRENELGKDLKKKWKKEGESQGEKPGKKSKEPPDQPSPAKWAKD